MSNNNYHAFSPSINIVPPQPTLPRNGTPISSPRREHQEFNFETEEPESQHNQLPAHIQQSQQYGDYSRQPQDYPQSPPQQYQQYPQQQTAQQSQNPYPQYPSLQNVPRPGQNGRYWDSRTNSYADSFSSSTVVYDSRTASDANLLSNANRIESSSGTLNADSRANSSTNLLRFGKPSQSPNKSQRVLGIDYRSEKPETVDDIFARDWLRDGSIIKVADRDDIDHMPKWKRYLFNTTPLWMLISLLTYWMYFSLRIWCVLAAQRAAQEVYLVAWIFIGIEFSVAIPTFLYSFMTLFIVNPRRRPKYRLTGQNVPCVDVFVTCCKEETGLVLDTVRGACDVDYPMDRFRVVVLDDGRDVDLEEKCEELRDTMYPNLFYRCREKIPGKPHHFKAGNLNYGFEEVTKMPGGAAQFAAALDADMIPEKEWLRAIMPHMLVDSKMALACPPQLFYNVPRGDPLSQSLDFFVHVLEGVKDALGVAWCTGSGYILRRDALEEIGWFPLGSLAEDVATSTLMLGKGWKTAFVHEPLQFGTVPEDFGSHLKQRTRWAIGTVDTALKLKFCLWGEGIRQMTFFQRLSGFVYAVLSVFNVFLTLSLFAMPIVLVSGKPLVAYATEDQLKLLIRFCFTALFVNRLTEIIMSLPSGYRVGQNGARSQIWMSPYISLCLVRAFVLPTWLGGQKQSFKPTGSLRSDLNERDPTMRAGLLTRLRVIVFSYMAWYHVLYVYFCLTAATLTSTRCAFETFAWKDRLQCELTHAFWPPVSWILVVSAFWVPLSYAIDPPTVAPRDELLDRDPKTLVAHPKETAKDIAYGKRTAWYEIEYTVTTIFTAFIFVAAFIWI